MKKQIQIKSQRKLILILISTLVGLSILGMLIGAFVDFQFSKLMVGNYDFTRTQGAKNLGFA
jgi:Na+/citrate or Na+/malate symporter